ncbi:hypothetical protein GCM10022409_09020 [Hymenobacter glaciei]|uniref:Uncharacterized protein n=2 Tax=Hymenobacter glaciei TaxID=877209 RepID=A0ABP7TJH3_9BACT
MVYQTDGTTSGGPQTGFRYYAGALAAWVFLNTSGVSYDPASGLQVGTGPVGSAGPFAVGTRSAAAARPFTGSAVGGKQALIYTAAELLVAGVRAGPITGVGFMVETKLSARLYPGLTVQLGTTVLTFFVGTFPTTGLTTVFSASYTTTAGLNILPCNAGSFVWDGTSSLLVSTCYGGTMTTFDDLVATFATGPATELSTSGATVSCATTTGTRTNVCLVLYLRQDGGSCRRRVRLARCSPSKPAGPSPSKTRNGPKAAYRSRPRWLPAPWAWALPIRPTDCTWWAPPTTPAPTA